jgi:Fe-S oxidoreductase
MNEMPRPVSLEAHLDQQARLLTDACTSCGKCVEVCPVVGEATPALASADPVEVVGGVVRYLQTGARNDLSETWIQRCTGSGECIAACPESINPRLMLSIALSRLRAEQSASGINPMGTYYRRMAQLIKLAVGMQMTPADYQRVTGRTGNPDTAEVVFYLGCNVLRTPVIVFSLMDILDAVGADYAMLGGAANCCGIIHLKFQGDANGSDSISRRTIDKLADFEPEKVLHWCPSCDLEFGETVNGFKEYPFDFEHISHFLVSRLDSFRERLQPVPGKVALHRHDGGLGIDSSVETLLAAIPELELVDIKEDAHFTYTCGPGGLSNVEDMREQAHRATMTSAVAHDADMLATLYHTCHRDLCGLEDQYPLEVKNWTAILARALGLPEHEDRYKTMKLHTELSAVLEDAQDFMEMHGLDTSTVAQFLPDLMAGRERGTSVW